MNAINLPVHIEREGPSQGRDWWCVMNGEGVWSTRVRRDAAEQITISLNCHDSLVDALKFYARKPEDCLNAYDPSSPGNMNDWKRIIGIDGGEFARAALAKVEDLRKNQH